MNNHPIEIFTTKPDDFSPTVEVVAVYVETKKNLLLLQRARSEKGLWTVPAGKAEKDEPLNHAAARELEEETGIQIDSNQLTELGQLYIKKPDIHYTYHLYHLKLDTKPEITISSEHLKYTWATEQESLQLKLMLGGKEALKQFRDITS